MSIVESDCPSFKPAAAPDVPAPSPCDATLTTAFDYEALPESQRTNVIQSTNKIRSLIRCSVEDVITIGRELATVKSQLKHGLFQKWLSAEFGWSARHARRMMAVSEAFKTDSLSDLSMSPSAAYLLAASSTPDEARREAVQRAERGEEITLATAKAIIGQHRPANKSCFGEQIRTVATEYNVPEQDLRQVVNSIWEQKAEATREWNNGKARAHKITGLTRNEVAKVINQGHDYASSQVNGSVGQKLRRLDLTAVTVAREHPELGLGVPEEAGANLVGRLWEVLCQERRALPSKADLLDSAARWLADQQPDQPVDVWIVRAWHDDQGPHVQRETVPLPNHLHMNNHSVLVEIAANSDPAVAVRLLRRVTEDLEAEWG